MADKTVIDELVTLLGYEISPKTKQSIAVFTTSLDSMKKKMQQTATVLTGLATAAFYFSDKANDASAEMKRMADTTGMSSDMLQGMGFAAEQVGGNFQGMLSDLNNLHKSMNSPIPGEFNQGLFLLGINTKDVNGKIKQTDQVLMEVSKRMQGMSDIEQMKWAERIGIGQDSLLLLKQGPQAIAAYRKQAADIPTIVSKEDLANAQQFGIQLKTVQRVVAYIGQTAASAAGPAMKKMVETFTKWLSANKEFIQQGLKNIINGIADGFTRFWMVVDQLRAVVINFLPWLSQMSDGLLDVETISSLVFGALAIVAATLIVMSAQWIAAAAGIMLVVAAFEDFMVYLQGGDSMMGRFAEKFPGIIGMFKNLWQVVKLVAGVIGVVFIESLKAAWAIVEKILTGWDLIFQGIGKLSDALGIGDLSVSYGQATAPTATAPGAPAGGSSKTEIKIEQNIAGGNATAAASETKRMTTDALQSLIPGATAPIAS